MSDDPQYLLQLPPDLLRQLDEAANLAGRALQAEVVLRLRQSLLGPALEPEPAAAAAPPRTMVFRDKNGQLIEIPDWGAPRET